MLGYLLRTLPVVLRARRHRDTKETISRLKRRVRLGEIDLNLHMNQAAFAAVMELGRVDWAIRTGAFATWRAMGVNFIVVDQAITYRRELKPWAAYEVDTRAIGVEGRLLLVESHILVGDRVHARGTVKLIFTGRDGVLPPENASSLAAAYLVDALSVENWQIAKAAPRAQ